MQFVPPKQCIAPYTLRSLYARIELNFWDLWDPIHLNLKRPSIQCVKHLHTNRNREAPARTLEEALAVYC